ncbi:MAG: DNA-directed DNA polymerase II small subunit [Promethearchaeota archaeon]
MIENNRKDIVRDFVKAGFNISPGALNYIAKRQDPKKFTKIILNSFSKKKTGMTITCKTLESVEPCNFPENEPPVDLNSSIDEKTELKPVKKEKPHNGEYHEVSGESDEFTEDLASIEAEVEGGFPASGANNGKNLPSTGGGVLSPATNAGIALNEYPTTSIGEPTAVSIQNNDDNNHDNDDKTIVSFNHTSKSTFIPLANEFDARIEILEDCTHNLKNEGGYKDFVHLFNSRIDKIKEIFLKRKDINNVVEIADISNISDEKQDICIIGMVVSKRTTKKGNLMVEVDDKSGSVNVVATTRTIAEDMTLRILLDEVLCFKGFYSGKRGKGIFIAKEIIWPGIKLSRNQDLPKEDLSIILISDIHLGSDNFLESHWKRFSNWMNGIGTNEKAREMAGKIKYVVIAGDLVDGVGVYPSQEEELSITSIYDQYEEAARMLADLPDHIQFIYSPGNHEPVRRALPAPAVSKKYAGPLYDMGCVLVGNPALVSTHGVKTLIFHGDSFIDLSMDIPGISTSTPQLSMRKLLESRHLAPSFGKKTEIAPDRHDWLVISEVPDIFHTGHVHYNGVERYRGVWMINSGCFQGQTAFMKSLGIVPTPGKPSLVNLKDLSLTTLNFS